jgi:hypothetical protein
MLFLYSWRVFSIHPFTTPVNRIPLAVVDLSKRIERPSNGKKPEKPAPTRKAPPVDTLKAEKKVIVSAKSAALPEAAEPHGTTTEPEIGVLNNLKKKVPIVKSGSEFLHDSSLDTPRQQRNSNAISPLLGKADNFMATKSEKFTYLISTFGVPIGSAELEATNNNGEILIILRVSSNDLISGIYPVYNVVETHHVDGKFILTKIRQLEGSFKSDEGFTINLEKKRVSSYNNLNGRTRVTAIPTDQALDTLSGLYYLRNRQLQVGVTEIIHVFDSETYEDVPVEILRKESVRLPNLTVVDTLVVQPLQKSAGIFRRTGDILIWLTDDGFKVPVKIVTTIALGTITAELVSAESTSSQETEE